MRIDRATLPAPHPQTAQAEATLGWALLNLGDAGSALPLFESADRADKLIWKNSTPETQLTADRFAACRKTPTDTARSPRPKLLPSSH